jgi:hypothetical protein
MRQTRFAKTGASSPITTCMLHRITSRPKRGDVQIDGSHNLRLRFTKNIEVVTEAW